MKRHEQAEAILNRFFVECGEAVPSQGEIEPVLDRVWQRLEGRADQFVDARIPAAAPTRPFRLAWAAGIVLAAVLVNGLVWRQGLPLSVAGEGANDPSLSRLSSQQAGEILTVTVPPDAFEVASVKVLSPSSEAGRNAKRSEEFSSALSGCSGGYTGSARIDPGRLTIPAVSLVGLIVTAYGQECKFVEGGPAWARSDEYYEINALLPAGTPGYTRQDLSNGNAPVLQRMLQNLLANRFRLVLKREFREMPVYALTVAKPGKMKLSPEEVLPAPAGFPGFAGVPAPPLGRGQFLTLAGASPGNAIEVQMAGHAISMSALARYLRRYASRFVVDKTGLNDPFDIELKFAAEVTIPLPPAMTPAAPTPSTPQAIPPVPVASLRSALEELGLKLEATRLPIEVLIIQSVERPSEN
jgi:uncharacterized protein (TIGR03435 family)